jgi:hypothetical protein
VQPDESRARTGEPDRGRVDLEVGLDDYDLIAGLHNRQLAVSHRVVVLVTAIPDSPAGEVDEIRVGIRERGCADR